MSKLQELLDERWPISEDATMADKLTLGSFRMIFTEGYNAAMEEIKKEFDFLPSVVRYTKKKLEEANK